MSATIELLAPSGLTLTVELFPYSSDVIANGAGGDALTEATNRNGLYTATVAETLSGWHTAHVKLSGTVIAAGDVHMIAGETCRVREHDPQISTEIAALAVVPLAAGAAAPAAGTLTIRRGDTVTLTVSGLAAQLPAGETWADVVQIWFGAKKSTDDEDADALLIVEDTDGLLVCNAVAAADLDATQTATITVTDAVDGDISIGLSAAATAALPERETAYWDVQVRTASGTYTLTAGDLIVTADVVRAVA